MCRYKQNIELLLRTIKALQNQPISRFVQILFLLLQLLVKQKEAYDFITSIKLYHKPSTHFVNQSLFLVNQSFFLVNQTLFPVS